MQRDDVTLGYLPVGHDPSLAIVGDRGVIAVAEEERYSRIKGGRFITDPQWVFEVLSEFGIEPASVTALAIPNVGSLHERRRADSLAGVPVHAQSRLADALVDQVAERLPRLQSVEYIRHHQCHAASAYLSSPFPDATVITADGMGETESATIWAASGGRLEQLHSVSLPHSIGYVYQCLAWWAGLTGVEREGKLMGLSSWGRPKHCDVLREHFIREDEELGFRVAANLERIPMNSAAWNEYAVGILGARREGSGSTVDRYAAEVAASAQLVVQDMLFSYISVAKRLGARGPLCAAGGVFMNTVANGLIRESAAFDDVWIQPLSGDNGLALGAALLSRSRESRGTARWIMRSAALGSPLSSSRSGVPSEAADLAVARTAADLVLSGHVIGWAQGRCEVGARALGHRSVLADARNPDSGERINSRLKGREKWRPFAPIVLADDFERICPGTPPSDFMTFVVKFPDWACRQFPAVVHVDGTARVQTVGPAAHPMIREFLLRIRQQTGFGIALNTSLNGPGQPIARTRTDALALFRSSHLDYLVLGNALLDREAAGLAPEQSASCAHGTFDLLVETCAPEPGDCVEAHASRLARLGFDRPSRPGGDLEARNLPDVLPGERIVVLLPCWLELAPLAMPRLLRWLLDWQDSLGRVLEVMDARGRPMQLDRLASTARPGLGGFGSPVEEFWLSRSAW
ncbi:MAG: hypothetical protein JWM19_5305 [Actinomycetia bacterium]|nr:hypothetical protein [Actinomycetes bacterium]